MCGIAGFLETRANGMAAEDRNAVLARMTDALRHRGPDDRGFWCDAEAGVWLGHRRLSIVDLSPAGHQPMVSQCGRFVIAYNGEIFSHREMRAELEAAGCTFRGHSDTEVMLEAISRWGLDATLPRLIGMFAIALWDRADKTLTLVRDRVGIKPLYWLDTGGLVLFGSELKALREHPGWTPEVDRDAIAAFMRHNYIPAPFSVYRDVRKLEAGCYAVFSRERPPRHVRYWDLREVVGAGQRQRRQVDDAQAIDTMEALLRDSVKRRMVADVPLGALLSGGIDSSLVTALMQAQSAQRVRTFSIGFSEAGYDEAPFAKAIAQHLGTEHTELYVEPNHALDIIPRLSQWWDEPFADSSQIPTYLVCELTRRHVTVVLSGDGGDEVFCGYTRYLLGAQLWSRMHRLPPALRRLLARTIRSVSPAAWERLAGVLPARLRPPHVGARAHKFADGLDRTDPDAVYLQMLSHWHEPTVVVLGSREARGRLWDADARTVVPNFVERMQYLDTLTYLPDDILTKVDRASMAVALEARVPLLDHRVVEAAWRLPLHMKLRDGKGKWMLRQILSRHVPPSLFERPKMGFGVPIDRWLRGPLRDWAEHLLGETRLRAQGLLDPAPIRARWQAHVEGSANWAYPLWNVLMLQSWIDRNPGVRV
jgi:asparagine synthase (glutamine-hydrolysing)